MLKLAFLTTSSGIIISRIFGFIRDVIFANTLGASIFTDIFFVSFKFANLFRRIFSEGAFTQAFLPSFIKSRQKATFSVAVLVLFTIIISAFCVIVSLFPYPFTKLLAYGFSEAHILEASNLLKIMFWYLLFIFISVFLNTILQYKHCFYPNAYGSVFLNLSLIFTLIIFSEANPSVLILYLSYAVLIGGLLQVAFSLFAFKRKGLFNFLKLGVKANLAVLKKIKDNQNYKLDKHYPKISHFINSFLPAVLGSSAAQICAFLDTTLASFLKAGDISYLYYANRVFQLPLSVFAIAIATAIFPSIAKAIKIGDETKALKLIKNGFNFLLLTLGACVMGGVMLSDEIVVLLFKRGAFSDGDVIATSMVFICYLIGLLPFGLSKLFSLYLYSKHMQGKAAIYTSISLIFSLISSLILMQYFGVFALAFSSSLSGFLLLGLNIKAFGFRRFLAIIDLKILVIISFILGIEFLVLPYIRLLFQLLIKN